MVMLSPYVLSLARWRPNRRKWVYKTHRRCGSVYRRFKFGGRRHGDRWLSRARGPEATG